MEDTEEKNKKSHVKLLWTFPWKCCSTTHLPFISSNPKILKAFLRTFPTKMKSTKRKKRIKNGTRKAKKGKGEKVKSKSQDCSVTFKPQNYLEVVLSVHSPTSQANILHLDHKAAKCMFFKWFYEHVLALCSTTVSRKTLN